MIGMANWLGVHRDTVHQWKTGATRSNTHYDLIKKAIDILEELWVDYMQNGKINPASGIFLGKNMFGYKDQQDLVVTPNNPLGEEPDPDKLVEQYQKALPPEDYRLSRRKTTMVNDFQTSKYQTTVDQNPINNYRLCPLHNMGCNGYSCAWYDHRNECCAIITLSRFK